MARMLVVLAHPARRDILVEFFEENSFEISQATDGVEGVKLVRTWQLASVSQRLTQ